MLEALFSLWGGLCFLEAGFKLGLEVINERETRTVSCWISKAFGATELEAGGLFKGMSLLGMQNAPYIMLTDQVAFPFHPIVSLSWHPSYPTEVTCLVCLFFLHCLSMPTTHLWNVVRHSSRIWAEPWWVVPSEGVSGGAATGWRSQPAVGIRRWLIERIQNKLVEHKHSLDQENTELPKIKRDASSNYS